MEDRMQEPSRGYWEDYYRHSAQTQIPLPSQFAVFVAGELKRPAFVVDVGCGSGRDALFFAQRGHHVLGIDGAEAAIDACRASATKSNIGADFLCVPVTDPTLASMVEKKRGPHQDTVLYARFFLHAISEEAEREFLRTAALVCKDGGLLAVEFRTDRDRALSKETPEHYRRYIEPAAFLSRAYGVGFSSEYLVEGFGFAKYGKDDAYVVRSLLRGH